MYEAGDKVKAQEILDQAIKLPNQSDYSLVNIAEIYALNGSHEQAVEFLNRVIKTYPFKQAPDYESSLAQKIISTYLKLEEYELALEVSSQLEDPEVKFLAVATIEIVMNKTNTIKNEKIQGLFSQIGCEVK